MCGDHDFCWSVESLLEFTRDPHAKVLLSNVEYSGASEDFGAVAFTSLDVGCVKIGFFGMVSKPWDERNRQYDGNFFDELPMRHDYVERARELVAAHRAEVDVLVMVSHLGLGDDIRIASEVEGIDFILGGHSHSVLSREEVFNNCVIIQAGSSSAFIARLDVDVDLQTRSVTGYQYRLDPNIPLAVPSDAELDATLTRVLGEMAPLALEKTARTKRSHSNERLAELTAWLVHGLGDVDTAICDPWTTWDPLPSGEVGPQDFLDCYKVERQPAGTPGFNAFYVIELSGADLARVRAEGDSAWKHAGLEAPEAETTYRVAVQKHIAYNPEEYLPDGVVASAPVLLGEAFELMQAWAERRTAAGLYFDADEAV